MTTQTDDRVEKAFNLVRNPALWPATTTDRLVETLVAVSAWLGVYYTEALFEEFRPFYWYVAERTTVKRRLEALTFLANLVERFEAGLAALLPFLCADEEPAVISTAALNLCVLIPPRNGDPLTGPRDVLDFLKRSDTDNSSAGVLQGVLLLGDRRVLPLLDRCWEPLGPEGRRILLHSWSGFVYASTIDFLLGWLESTSDDSEYGAIAGVLASYPIRRDAYPFVLDVERKIPANGPGNGPFVKQISRWTFKEYGAVLAPRLQALAEAETGEKVIPNLLAAWGIP